MIDIGDDLSKIAAMLAKTGLSNLVGETERMEIFKLLTAYHLGICKVGSKKTDDGDKESEGSIDGFRERVAAAAGGDGENRPD